MKRNIPATPPGVTSVPGAEVPDLLDQYLDLEQRGVHILQIIKEKNFTLERLLARGMSRPRALSFLHAADIFFGPTRQKKLQAENRQLVLQKGLSLEAVCTVASSTRHVTEDEDFPLQLVLHRILRSCRGWIPAIEKITQQVIIQVNTEIFEAQCRRHEEKLAAERAAEKARRAQDQAEHKDTASPENHPDGQPDKSSSPAHIPETDTGTGSNTGGSDTTSNSQTRENAPDQPPANSHEQSSEDPPPSLERLPYAFFRNTRDASGHIQLVYSGPSAGLAQLRTILEPHIRRLRKKHPELTYSQALARVLAETQAAGQRALAGKPTNSSASSDNQQPEESLSGTSPDSLLDPVGRRPFQPFTIIHSKRYRDFTSENPSEDTLKAKYGSNDGTIQTGKELAERGMGRHRTFLYLDAESQHAEVYVTRPHLAQDDSEAALEETITRLPGKLDLGTETRSPNRIIRAIVDAVFLQCVWPGCDMPGIFSQYHHAIAAKHNGPTSVWNMLKLCATHNGMNDDDRDRPVNGFVYLDDGALKYQPPDGSDPIEVHHPLNDYGALAISQQPGLLSLSEILQGQPPGLDPPKDSPFQPNIANPTGSDPPDPPKPLYPSDPPPPDMTTSKEEPA